jgi:hypothetical protein
MLKPAALAVALLWPLSGHAGELPCPPKRYLCIEVRLAAAAWGEQALRDKAKKCGWSDRKIDEASKCLRP